LVASQADGGFIGSASCFGPINRQCGFAVRQLPWFRKALPLAQVAALKETPTPPSAKN